jgi:hypothetical protein
VEVLAARCEVPAREGAIDRVDGVLGLSEGEEGFERWDMVEGDEASSD